MSNDPYTPRFALGWTLRTAWRDARGTKGKALLYIFSMALGITALVAMMSFEADLGQSVKSQTRDLMGADLLLFSRQPPGDEVRAWMDGLAGEKGEISQFATMAFIPKNDEALFVRARGVTGGFPFYGEIETMPAEAAATYRDGANALVDQSLLERTDTQVGDIIRIGEQDFTITGAILKTQGEPPSATLFGPRVYIPGRFIGETKLIRTGSMVFYTQAIAFPQGTDVDALVAENREMLRENRVSPETVRTRQDELGEALGQLGQFLNLTACLALLLGGVGVASAVHYHLRRKQREIAVLRCIGATTGQVLRVYVVQSLAMALIAGLLGVAAGVAVQFALPPLVQAFIPFDFTPNPQPVAIITAMGWGLLLTTLLTLAPLLAIRHISPLQSFRIQVEPPKGDWLKYGLYTVIALAWWLFAVRQTESLQIGSYFLGGLVVSILILAAMAKFLGALAKRLRLPSLPFSLRHGVAALFRPYNQTTLLTVVLGAGIFLLAVLTGVRSMLLNQFTGVLESEKPNFIAFDIQPDQVDGVVDIVRAQELPVQDLTPVVAMRLESVKGVSVADLIQAGDIPLWSLQREYRSTYRDQLTPTEDLVAGEFVPRFDDIDDVIPVSLETDIAEALSLDLGDQLVMDVLGLPLTLEVASLRKVDWQSLQPNFFIVFPEGVLDAAPQMFLFTTRTQDPAQVAALQRELVQAYPNVTCADMTQLIQNLDEILAKAAAVVEFLAGLCLLTGLFVLGSALWNSRQDRRGEQALMRTLGARGRQLTRIALAEYFLLGFFAAASGVLLAFIANWSLGRFVFQTDALPDLLAVVTPLLVLPLLTLLVGLLIQPARRDAAALAILRGE